MILCVVLDICRLNVPYCSNFLLYVLGGVSGLIAIAAPFSVAFCVQNRELYHRYACPQAIHILNEYLIGFVQGQSGNAVQYVTRNQALKKLQLKLSEFRRLCILKGIHPREPKKKVQGAHKTYYHVKDISFLLHEPLLKKVRELAAYDKKIRKANAKKNRELAKRLASLRPGYRLDHLVRERYPSFIDALRDIDDALTLIHLFAVLPAETTRSIPSERVQMSRRLALEWQAWIARSGALRKAFVSVKGFYFQAEVRGQDITWLVPHQTAQVLPPDVDFKVMMTFLELYHTTVQFVLFKLYTESGLRYPPTMNEDIEGAAGGALSVISMGSSNTKNEVQDGHNRNIDSGTVDEGCNPKSLSKLKNLSAKVAELEAEIRTIGNTKKANEKAGKNGRDSTKEMEDSENENSEDESDEDPEFEIDSGDESEEEEEKAEESSDSEDESSDEENDGDNDNAEDSKNISSPEDPSPLVALPSSSPGVVSQDADPVVGGAIDVDDDDIASVCSSLFKGIVFFLGREVPREQLLLVIRSFGGEAGWAGEGSPIAEDDARITHQIMDRPTIIDRKKNREYVQPQWVFDSANARVLVRTSHYQPGKVPPPHLSPFVDADSEGYEPEYAKEIRQLQEAARAARKRAAGVAVETAFLTDDGKDELNKSSVEEDEEEVETRYVLELNRELGTDKVESDKDVATETPAAKRKRQEDDDEESMKDIMMTRKVRRAYQKAKAQERAKKERAENLQARAKELRKSRL